MTKLDLSVLANMCEYMDEMESQPKTPELFLVLPEWLVFDCAREADRLAITKTVTGQDGTLKINVLHARDGQELTFEQRDFLEILNAVKLVKHVPLTISPPTRDSRLKSADSMANLRRFTGQDWRGRR